MGTRAFFSENLRGVGAWRSVAFMFGGSACGIALCEGVARRGVCAVRARMRSVCVARVA